MPNVVFDASSLIGALLKQGSIPECALLLARATDIICLSVEVEAEIREVFTRPRFGKYLTPGRTQLILDVLTASAVTIVPTIRVTDCRDVKDNKYLELVLASGAATLVADDGDLLTLDPWRGVRIMTPAEYVAGFETL
jgi:uncharacterized protein